MLNVCETLLFNVKNNFKQDKRTSAELSEKMHQLFQDNIADYEKLASWYDESKPTINIIAKAEDFKKLVYGDDYEIKKFKW